MRVASSIDGLDIEALDVGDQREFVGIAAHAIDCRSE